MPRVEFCSSCGAPLEARWSEIVIECRYCGCQNAPGGPGDLVPPSTPDDGRPRFAVGGRTYVVQGRLGEGDACDVYRGRWVMRLGELVVIKVLRSLSDADLLRRGWSFLERLHESPAQGADHFVSLLPQPIALGPIKTEDGRERLVGVYRWQSGFQHTLEDVTREHPNGVDARIVVWMLKRLLELLGFTHLSGVVHGAITPGHVLIHPRDHGATLIGWSTATAYSETSKEPLPALSRRWKEFYPEDVQSERWVSPRTDLTMAARCALKAAGGKTFLDPGTLPGGLGRVIVNAAWGGYDDAWALREQVDRESSAVHGPSSYNPLPMPGWKRIGS